MEALAQAIPSSQTKGQQLELMQTLPNKEFTAHLFPGKEIFHVLKFSSSIKREPSVNMTGIFLYMLHNYAYF